MSLEGLYRKLNRKALKKEKAAGEARILVETELPPASNLGKFEDFTLRPKIKVHYRSEPRANLRDRSRSVNSRSAVEDANRITRKLK